MLPNRQYKPEETETIYHYCSPDSFFAICNSKTLRFSDIFSMNDFMEMHWGHSVWVDVRKELLEVPLEFLDVIDEHLFTTGMNATTVASCFSLDGDVLSQWRAYTDDGLGFCIGFDPKVLCELPVRPLSVLYERERQIEELSNLVRAIYQEEKDADKKYSEDFVIFCQHLLLDFAAFKNPAFKEEREIRLLHALQLKRSNESLKLVDAGGTSFAKLVDPAPVNFRMKGGTPVAYIDLDFTFGGDQHPIREVIIGPKNLSLLSGVSVFLETLGISNVEVKKSKASYR